MDKQTLDVELIPLQPEHLEMLRTWRNMSEISQYMFNEGNITEAQQMKWYAKVKKDPAQLHWIVKYKNEFVGAVSLNSINQKFKTCSWGFYIGNLKFRGEGLGYKMLYLLLIKVFEEMKLNKVIAEVLIDNKQSIKLHETLGFRREGYYREHVLKNNVYYDVVAFGYLEKEWNLLKEPLYQKINGTEN